MGIVFGLKDLINISMCVIRHSAYSDILTFYNQHSLPTEKKMFFDHILVSLNLFLFSKHKLGELVSCNFFFFPPQAWNSRGGERKQVEEKSSEKPVWLQRVQVWLWLQGYFSAQLNDQAQGICRYYSAIWDVQHLYSCLMLKFPIQKAFLSYCWWNSHHFAWSSCAEIMTCGYIWVVSFKSHESCF